MLAALESGFLSKAGPRWLLAEMHPGNQPFANLARALLESTLLGKSWTDHEDASPFLTVSCAARSACSYPSGKRDCRNGQTWWCSSTS